MLSVAAVNDGASVSHNGIALGNALANDTVEATNLAVSHTSVSLTVLTGTTSGAGQLTFVDAPTPPTPSSGGESPPPVVLGSAGDWTYQPPEGVFTGTAAFSYTVTDSDTGATSTATVTITLTNDAPCIINEEEATNGVDGEIWGEVGTTDPIVIDVDSVILPHFADPDGDSPLEIEIVNTIYGTAVVSSSSPQVLTYTPPAGGFVGGDPFDEIVIKAKDRGGLRSNQLRFFPRGSGAIQGQGIFLTDRAVQWTAGLGMHSAIVIIPTNQAAWESDARFTRKIPGTNTRYATISAHPDADWGTDELWSEVNWASDKWENLKMVERLNFGGIAEDDMIQYLFDLDSVFDDDVLGYELVPDANDSNYNSNSYIHGLLNAAGITPGVALGWHPGWDKPVPQSEFVAD